jgi:rhodanese-related sulfurtransferase
MSQLINLTPHDLAEKLQQGQVLLIDVREPAEFAQGSIAGAQLHPLSEFDPTALPQPQSGQIMVLYCAGGVRSAKAVALCQQAGLACNTHLAGGIGAWKMAGLPVET